MYISICFQLLQVMKSEFNYVVHPLVILSTFLASINGQAIISMVDTSYVVYRPGHFTVNIAKTGRSQSAVGVIVQVCEAFSFDLLFGIRRSPMLAPRMAEECVDSSCGWAGVPTGRAGPTLINYNRLGQTSKQTEPENSCPSNNWQASCN